MENANQTLKSKICESLLEIKKEVNAHVSLESLSSKTHVEGNITTNQYSPYFVFLNQWLLEVCNRKILSGLDKKIQAGFTDSGWGYLGNTFKANICDMDDTACAIIALGDRVSANHLATFLKLLMRHELSPGGPYLTWVNVEEEKNDVDCIVNANIAFALKTNNIPIPRPLDKYLEQSRTRAKSRYYTELAVHFLMTRAGYPPVKKLPPDSTINCLLNFYSHNDLDDVKRALEGPERLIVEAPFIIEAEGARKKVVFSNASTFLILEYLLHLAQSHTGIDSTTGFRFDCPAFVRPARKLFEEMVAKNAFVRTHLDAFTLLTPDPRLNEINALIWFTSYLANDIVGAKTIKLGQLLWSYRHTFSLTQHIERNLSRELFYGAEVSLSVKSKRALRTNILTLVPLSLCSKEDRVHVLNTLHSIYSYHQISDDLLDRDLTLSSTIGFHKLSAQVRTISKNISDTPPNMVAMRAYFQALFRQVKKQQKQIKRNAQLFKEITNMYRPSI